MPRQRKNHGKTLTLGFLFAAAIILLIVFSFIIKTVILVQKSKFDGYHRFTIGVFGNTMEVVSFSPQTSSISIVDLGKTKNMQLLRSLEIPIDAAIYFPTLDFKQNNVISQLWNILLRPGIFKKGFTSIDILRLIFFSKALGSKQIHFVNIPLGSTNNQIQSDIGSDFVYPSIVRDGDTIQVVNGTQVSGLASRLSIFISNMGGNVVLVSTDTQNVRDSEIIYSGKSDYTVNKLSKVLGFKKISSITNNIADVTILIGEDSVKDLKF